MRFPARFSAAAPVLFFLAGLVLLAVAAPPPARVPVLVVLREQVPLAELEELAARPGGRARAIARLRALARREQAAFLAALGEVADRAEFAGVRPLWIVNAVALEAGPALRAFIAARPEVERVVPDPPREVFFPADGGPVPGPIDRPVPAWGVARVGAPEAWRSFGIDGTGVLVAVVDTGVAYDHPDLLDRVWVNPGEDLDGDGVVMDPDDRNGVDDDGNGFVDDLCGWDFDDRDADPYDRLSGHGTHVAGIIAGTGHGGTATGVAPGARLLPVRVGHFASQASTVWEGLQYAAENGARVINLSMGWRHAWHPDRAAWRRVAEAVRATGALLVAAAGNDGWGRAPDNVRTPADVPGVLAVGATRPGDAVAFFSSRGPVTWQDVPPWRDWPFPPGLVKPDVAAPGVDVPSTWSGGGYVLLSGTSMAAPHVAGAAALVLDANPALGPGEVARVLEETALDLGSPGKDDDSGAGRVDAFAAVERAARGLAVAGWRLDDAPPRGNGDGYADPGEEPLLFVALENRDLRRAAEGVRARLVAEDDGIAVLGEGPVPFPSIPPGGRAEASVPFRVRVHGPCAVRVRFRVELSREGETPVRGRFTVPVGHPEPAVLFADDFSRDRGWLFGGTASGGAFARGVPEGTRGPDGTWANPPADSDDPGEGCLVTGPGGGDPLADDLDGGPTEATSPLLDARRFVSLRLRFRRWFRRAGEQVFPAQGWLVAEVSDDGGATWLEVDAVAAGKGGWVRVERDLSGLVRQGSGLLLRFRAADLAPGDVLTEAGIDDVRLEGEALACAPAP